MKKYLLLISGIFLFAGLVLGLAKPSESPRAQAATTVSSGSATVSYPTTFDDVPISHWAYWYIEAVAQNGLTHGCTGQLEATTGISAQYCPDMNTSMRQQVATFAVRQLLRLNPSAPICRSTADCPLYYKDVDYNHMYGQIIQTARRNGLTRYPGWEGQNFYPDNPVTRSEIASIIYSMSGNDKRPPDDPDTCMYDRYCYINRAQMAGYFAVNFNLNIQTKISGELTVENNSWPVSDLSGATVTLLKSDGTVLATTAVAIANNVATYSINFQKSYSDLKANFVGKVFKIKITDSTNKFQTQEVSFALSGAKININHTLVPKTITVSGQIKIANNGNCPSVLANLNGMKVAVERNNDNEYKQVNTSYANGILSYSVDLPQPNFQNATYRLIPLDYAHIPHSYPEITVVDPLTSQAKMDLEISAPEITYQGRVKDVQTLHGIGKIYVYVDPEVDIKVTDKNGNFKIILKPDKLEDLKDFPLTITPAVSDSRGYMPRAPAPIQLTGCPLQYGDFTLDKKPDCPKILNIVYICWYGEEAKKWHNDPNLTIAWQDMANHINHLRASTKNSANFKVPNRINIVSGSADFSAAPNHWLATPDYPFLDQINIGTKQMMAYGGPQSTMVLGALTHEYGHLYFGESAANGGLHDTQFADWVRLWQKGIHILGEDESNWATLTDSTYDGSAKNGHPMDDPHELFASTFFIMFSYKAELNTKIQQMNNPTWKSYFQEVYNKMLPNAIWP